MINVTESAPKVARFSQVSLNPSKITIPCDHFDP